MIREWLTDWWATRTRIRAVRKFSRFMIDVDENDIRTILNEIEAEQSKTQEGEKDERKVF